ncbi:MAG TPA: NUDIX hydrolase [Polyangiales bacterium]|nr:NUDIX hydrolase [Polyangiales bacterium]
MNTAGRIGDPGKRRIRASVVCVYRAQLLCVRLRDPHSGLDRLFVPGGALEPGESAAHAAERETFEETGYRVAVELESELTVTYPFVWNGTLFDVTTHFFRGALQDPIAQPRAAGEPTYNEGVQWLALSELERELGFDAAILGATRRLLVP